ncbi:MAG TPA: hypothetical protein VMS56_03000 [Thermoanaerobaculia bacterium]|nr:hypothetical protein [Thermoanaerobaculia bacterium]
MTMVAEENESKAAYWLPARLGEHRVMLIDYSPDGILIEHYRPLESESRAVFLLEWEGERVAVMCRLVQCEKFPVSWGSSFSVYRSSLIFVERDGELERRIAKMIEARHQVSITLQLANASGRLAASDNHPLFRNGLVTVDATERLKSHRPAEFVKMLWSGRKWTSSCTLDPSQPPDGFTVDAEEPSQQIQRLCEAYEKTSPEGRNLIRAQARLALEGRKLGRHTGRPKS